MSVADGPSGTNDEYLSGLDDFLTDVGTINAQNDDTSALASMTRLIKTSYHTYFLFGSGSNQHNQLLLKSKNNAAGLVGEEDAHDRKEIVLFAPRESSNEEPHDHLPSKIFVGGGHSGLLTDDGKLYVWGWNRDGQLGTSGALKHDDDTDGVDLSDRVIRPLQDIKVEDAAFGFSHTLVIEEGTQRLYSFGSNERGQVDGKIRGDSSVNVETPVTPSFLKDDKITAVAAGLFHSAVITSEGELVTFGCGRFGQSLTSLSSPASESFTGNRNSKNGCVGRWKPEDGARLVDVACGRRHTVAVDEKGRVWSFGENKHGQLGRSLENNETKDPVPGLVEGLDEIRSSPNGRYKLISGWSHTILTVESAHESGEDDESVTIAYGWGRNDKGRLGTGTTEPVALPKRVFADKAIQSIACGSVSTMLLDKSNDIWGSVSTMLWDNSELERPKR